MDKNGPQIVGVLYGRDLTDGTIGVAATTPGKYLVRVGVSRALINALSWQRRSQPKAAILNIP